MAGAGTAGEQELAKALRAGSRAVAISSISAQGSALLFLGGPQSRDCVRNWKAGDAAKKSVGFMYEKTRNKAA